MTALTKYQDKETGLWYEVTNKPDEKGNWVESSCSCLFTYAYAKAVNMGVVARDEFSDVTKKAYDGIISSLDYKDGFMILGNVCIGTCIEEGTYDYYIKRPVTENDLHGSGAFVLMCQEMQKYFDKDK